MNRYKDSKIYKIECSHCDDIYVGSTYEPKLSKRMAKHRMDSKDTDRKSNLYLHMRDIGLDNFKIVLIESFHCNGRDELVAREDYWIKTLKPKLNVRNAVFNEEKTKETMRKYSILNRDKKSIYNKNYHIEHLEDRRLRARQFREKNKDEIYKKSKLAREKNVIEGRFRCEICEHSFDSNCRLERHNITIKHQLNLLNQLPIGLFSNNH